jgi:P27 family predicted phage terminase small subunit
MGARGPQPVPTSILAARGSRLAPLRRKQGEPRPDVETPDCPDWLGDDAKEVWFQVVPMLVSLRVLSRDNAVALARYCDALVQWKKAALFLTSSQTLVYAVKSKTGETVAWAPWPQNALYEKFHRILTSLEDRFGLTPSARSRITLTQKLAEDSSGNSKLRFFNAG